VPLYFLIFNNYGIFISTLRQNQTELNNQITPTCPPAQTSKPVTINPATKEPITTNSGAKKNYTLEENFNEFIFIQEYYCKKIYKQATIANMNTKAVNIALLEKTLNIPMYLYASGDIVSSSIHASGSWDLNKLVMMINNLEDYRLRNKLERKEVIFVDIGTNIGWFSIFAAHLGFTVVSFEPMQANEIILRNNICVYKEMNGGINKNWIYVNLGLGEAKRTCKMMSGNINEGDGITICNNEAVPGDYKIRSEIDIDRIDVLMPLDKFEPPLKIGLVKIDVENHERYVFDGGEVFFNKYDQRMVVEFLNMPGLDPKYHANNVIVFEKLKEWKYMLSTAGFGGTKINDMSASQRGEGFDAFVWR
jgi:FkbM family methyltransferase